LITRTFDDTVVELDTIGTPIACITLDLEQDFGHLGHYMKCPTFDALSLTDVLMDYLSRVGLPITCFVQGSVLETHPDLIDRMRKYNVEFEVHTYSHPPPQTIEHAFEARRGWEIFTAFFGKEPLGYRSPSGMISEELFSVLPDIGYRYDSSVVPSFRPGVYSGLGKPVLPYFIGGSQVIEFPVTVFSRHLRVPISLSYQKFFGAPYRTLIRLQRLPEIVIFCFHLHDLLPLPSIDTVPADLFSRWIFWRMYKRGDGMSVLHETISVLKEKKYSFARMDGVYQKIQEGQHEHAG